MSVSFWLLVPISVIACLAGVYLSAAYVASRWLTRPTRGKPPQSPGYFGIPWEPAVCRTVDGVRLAGWVLNPHSARGTIVLHHGLRGSREQTLGRAVLFARAGYRSVAFDHRGHGESEGGFTSFGYHEARDVAAVQELVCRRWPGQPRAVLGLSMGAAAICFAAEQARGYHAIILESLYHDIASAFASRLRTMYPVWFRPLVPGIICITERRMGVRLEEVVPAALIGKLAPAPVLLVTGTNDDHAGTEVAERLLACCGKPRDLWLVPGAAHCDVFEVGGQRYEERILAFLEHSLGFQGV